MAKQGKKIFAVLTPADVKQEPVRVETKSRKYKSPQSGFQITPKRSKLRR